MTRPSLPFYLKPEKILSTIVLKVIYTRINHFPHRTNFPFIKNNWHRSEVIWIEYKLEKSSLLNQSLSGKRYKHL